MLWTNPRIARGGGGVGPHINVSVVPVCGLWPPRGLFEALCMQSFNPFDK